MTTVSTEITNLQNQTAFTQSNTTDRKTSSKNDSSMFLNLMLQQLKNQDPTQPTDNTEWLSQLAQYSSLEQMTQMNTGLTNCMNYISAMYNDMAMNAEITQTLSMVGKEVTITVPDEKDSSKTTEITGKVTEANFKDGTGKVKVNGEYYSISNISLNLLQQIFHFLIYNKHLLLSLYCQLYAFLHQLDYYLPNLQE